MKFEIFNFKKVTSTNDVAISLIRNDNKKRGYVFAKNKQKEGELLGSIGSLKKAICLVLFSLN